MAQIDPRAMQQVMDAIMRQQGGVPSGPAYTNPNFTMPGATPKYSPFIMSGEGTIPGAGVATGGMPGLPIPQNPMINVTPQADVAGLSGLGGNFAAEGTGADAVAEAFAKNATKINATRGLAGSGGGSGGGMFTRGLKGLAGRAPLMSAGAIAASPALLDPGSEGVRKLNEGAGLEGSNAQKLQDADSDNWVDSAFKAWMRGEYAAANAVADGAKYLTSTRGERKAGERDKTQQTEQSRILADMAKDGISIAPRAAQGDGGMSFNQPQAGVNPQDDRLQKLQEMMLGLKPERAEIPKELTRNMNEYDFYKAAAGNGPATNGSSLMNAIAGMKSGSIREQMMGLQNEGTYKKATQDWLKEYVKSGIDMEKERRQEARDDFKVHAGKGGFLIESRDPSGKVTIKPIHMGGGSDDEDSGGKGSNIMGAKFDKKNPFSDELKMIHAADQVGILQEIMNSNPDAMIAATKGLTDEKQMAQAKILTIAKLLKTNPQFKQNLMTKYNQTIGVDGLQ